MTQTKVSPLTSDYIQELCQHKDGLREIGVGNGASVDASDSLEEQLERVYPSETERIEKARKLELLVRWHKMLASRSSSGTEQLLEVEQQIFEILRGQQEPGKGSGEATQASGSEGAPSSGLSGVSDLTAGELSKLCNHICEIGILYLGGVTSTYLQASRPQFEWLHKFEIQRSGRMQYTGSPSEAISALELYWCRRWMGDFISQCSAIVQSFVSALDTEVLERLGLNTQTAAAEESEALMAGFTLD